MPSPSQPLKGVPGVKVVEEENVAETDAVSKTMESMINLDGAKLILATSFGYYSPFVVEAAKAYPEVHVPPCGAALEQGQGSEERRQLFRLPRPGPLHRWRRCRASPRRPASSASSPPSRSASCSATSTPSSLGARSVNPAATVQVIFTGEWSMPVREAEATNALVDAGCDLITCHVDGPKVVIQTAEGRGVKTCGHNASQASLAPKGFVTGAEYKWETIYKQFAATLSKGEALPNITFGGYDLDMVQNTPYGAGARREDDQGHQ